MFLEPGLFFRHSPPIFGCPPISHHRRRRYCGGFAFPFLYPHIAGFAPAPCGSAAFPPKGVSMNRILTRLGFTAAAIVAGSGIVAHAQTTTTGAVSGIVTDAKGAPVAGVTVRLTSTQTTRQAVTGAD